MGKKGKGKRKKSGMRASASGSQTSASTSTPLRESEEKDSNIQEDERSEKNVTGDQKSKNKDRDTSGEVQSVSPVAENIKKSDESTHKLKKGNEADEKLKENVGLKMEHRNKGQELEKASKARQEDVSTQPSRDQCYFTCAPPATATTHSELLQSSKGEKTDEQKDGIQKSSEVQQKFSQEIEGAEVTDIDERIRNLDLNAPQVQDVASENIEESNEQNIEHDETINLGRDVNLRFEFDTPGSKRISVDDKVFYDIKEKQKMTFDIGGGDVQLSFLGNNVYIFTQRSKIDLSIQNNQMIFSITDETERKDISVVKDLGISDTARAVDDDFVPSEMCPEGDSEHIKQSISKAIPSSAEKYVEQCLQNVTENFLASVKATCEKFEASFLESLKERSKD